MKQAEIPCAQLRICLEPEAAAIFCMTVRCQSDRVLSTIQLERFKPGSRYILIDAGGWYDKLRFKGAYNSI